MQMDVGLDTGDVILEKRLAIEQQNAAQLHDQLADIGAQAIVETLNKLAFERVRLTAEMQPEDGVTYAAKLEKAEAALDLQQDALTLGRRIRAFNPVPGANLRLPGLAEPVKVWQAEALDIQSAAEPGTVLQATSEGIDIATGSGVLRLLELQKAGGKRQAVAAFVSGWKLPE